MMANEVKAGPQPGWSAADNHDHPAEQKPATVEETPLPVAGTPNATVATQNNEVETTTAKSETPNTDGDAQNAEEAIAVEAEPSISEGETQITTTEETTDSETESTETTDSETLSAETAESETFSTETTDSETLSAETAESETFSTNTTESETLSTETTESETSSSETAESETSSFETTELVTSSAETANNNNNDADFNLKPEQQDQTEMKKTNLLTTFVSLLFGSTNAADKYNVSSGKEVEQSEPTQGNWKIEGNIYANLSIIPKTVEQQTAIQDPEIDKPPPTTDKITTEHITPACKCNNDNVGRMRFRDEDYGESQNMYYDADGAELWNSETKKIIFNSTLIQCKMDTSSLQLLRDDKIGKYDEGTKKRIIKVRIMGKLNKDTIIIIRDVIKKMNLQMIKLNSCLWFEETYEKDIQEDFLPDEKYAHLFLKIHAFAHKKYKSLYSKKLFKNLFLKKLTIKDWKDFLKKYKKTNQKSEGKKGKTQRNKSRKKKGKKGEKQRKKETKKRGKKRERKVQKNKKMEILQQWKNFPMPNPDYMRKKRKKIQKYWQKHMSDLSPDKILSIQIGGSCQNKLSDETWTGGHHTHFNRTIFMSKGWKGKIKNDVTDIIWQRTLIHEIFHSLGLEHTQLRSDRDKHIKMLKKNIRKDYKSQFDICKSCKIPEQSVYECDSIMHYGPTQGAKSSEKPTFRPKKSTCSKPDRRWYEWPTQNDWIALNNTIGCYRFHNDSRALIYSPTFTLEDDPTLEDYGLGSDYSNDYIPDDNICKCERSRNVQFSIQDEEEEFDIYGIYKSQAQYENKTASQSYCNDI